MSVPSSIYIIEICSLLWKIFIVIKVQKGFKWWTEENIVFVVLRQDWISFCFKYIPGLLKWYIGSGLFAIYQQIFYLHFSFEKVFLVWVG